MTLHADDPRLTAYVLGELTDDERAEFERELAESPEAERELVEIRETISLLQRELAAESLSSHGTFVGTLSEVEGNALADAAAASTTSPEWNTHLGWRLTSYAAAAALLVAVGYFTLPRGQFAVTHNARLYGLNGFAEPGAGAWGYRGGTSIVMSTPDAESTNTLQYSLTPQAEARTQQFDTISLGTIGSGNGAPSSTTSQNAAYPGLSTTTAGLPFQRLQQESNLGGVGYFSGDNDAATVGSLSNQIPTLAGKGSISNLEPSVLGRVGELNGMPGQVSEKDIAYTIAKPVYPDHYRRHSDRLSMMVTPRLIVQEEEEELLGRQGSNTEAYAPIVENPFLAVMQNPLSTFSIDVDTASYSNVRRFLTGGSLPPPGAVRLEEMVNYFPYSYAPPAEGDAAPFAAHLEVAECPWRPEHRLVRVGLKGREIASEDRPASNLVFLLDVSGSMDEPNKLPLVKEGLRMLVNGLRENDRVAIVVYAGASGLVLDSTSGDNKETILAAINELSPGGSTNGASGIQLAYDVAARHFIKEGTNRVILATDGDFNVGITDESQLVKLIEEQAKTGVFLSVLGFGMGNLKDSTLEQLADRGNGNYAYVDSDREARKVLVDQLSGTLVTIAKDLKIQVEFNPARVAGYRLIGYENRLLAKEDFNDDTKDAGEIGAGHTVTALYEVVLAESTEKKVEGDGVVTEEAKQAKPAIEREVDELEYLSVARPTEAALASPNLLMLKLRYKEPEGTESKLLKFPVEDVPRQIGEASTDFQLAASVAAFGMLLRGSQFAGSANMDAIMEWAQPTLSADPDGYRRELVDLMRTARELAEAQQQSQQQQQQ